MWTDGCDFDIAVPSGALPFSRLRTIKMDRAMVGRQRNRAFSSEAACCSDTSARHRRLLGSAAVATLLSAVPGWAATFTYPGAVTTPINPADASNLTGTIIISPTGSVTTAGGGNHAIQPWFDATTGVWHVIVDGSVQVTTPDNEIYGVWLRKGGDVTIGSSGLVQGSRKGIVIEGGAGQVVNNGTVRGSWMGAQIVNGGTVQNNGSIEGGVVFASNVPPGALINTGSISGNRPNGFGIIMNAGGTFDNSGTIAFHNTNLGFSSFGNVVFTNNGSLVATADPSFALQTFGAHFDQGTVTATNTGRIEGRDLGLRIYRGPSATLTNSGTIKGGTLDAVRLEPTAGPATFMQTGGLVEGGRHGLYTNTTGASTLNITGGEIRAGLVSNLGVGVIIAGSGSAQLNVSNATISGVGAAIKGGTGAFSVSLGAGSVINGDVLLGSGNTSLTMHTGATVNGDIDAGTMGGELTLTGSGHGAFGGTFLNFRSAEINTPGGSWTLAGGGTFPGGVTVNAGTLIVDGMLDGDVTTGPSGVLRGSGVVGTMVISPGGIVAPGNSIGTLAIVGGIRFEPGSTYQVEVDSAGNSDLIGTLGTATLNGGTVQVLAANGSYRPSTEYIILAAKGGVTGKFTGLTSNLAFLTPTLGYEREAVTLTLVRKTEPKPEPRPEPVPVPVPGPEPVPVAFSSVAVTKNQFRTADAVEALGEGAKLFDAVIGQSADGARQAFDALSGEVHGSAAAVTVTGSAILRETLLGRMRKGEQNSVGAVSAAYAADRPGAAPKSVDVPFSSLDTRRFSLWGEGFGSWGKIRSNGNAAAVDTSTGGFILGAEANLDPAYTIGIAGGFTRTSFDVDARLSSGANESTFGAIYGATRWGAIHVRLGASYAHHDIDTARTVVFPGYADQASAAYDGSTVQAFSEIGYRFDWGKALIEPFIGASILRLRMDGFAENGGAAALIGLARTYDLGTTTLGVRMEARLSDDIPLTLRGMLGWRHAYGDVNPDALLTFQGGASAFAVSGVPIDLNALVAEAGLDWQATKDMSLGISYGGQIGSRAQEHALKGNFTWRF